MFIPIELYEARTEAQDVFLDWLASTDPRTSHVCDTYIAFVYPDGHPDKWMGEAERRTWLSDFRRAAKGIAVLTVHALNRYGDVEPL